jgi:hypothetical protein
MYVGTLIPIRIRLLRYGVDLNTAAAWVICIIITGAFFILNSYGLVSFERVAYIWILSATFLGIRNISNIVEADVKRLLEIAYSERRFHISAEIATDLLQNLEYVKRMTYVSAISMASVGEFIDIFGDAFT